MKTLLLACILLAGICFSFCTRLPVDPCGANLDIDVTAVDLDPYPVPSQGGDLNITITGSLDGGFAGGMLRYTLTYYGITVVQSKLDICDSLAQSSTPCPLPSGPFTITTTRTLPAIPEAGEWKIEAKIIDSAKQEDVACYAVQFTMG
mmetsp:Transcript_20928/g.54040  ORF Transcript_20928/g.54040 Transcript_20928/m.54040 type:complete len:148 (-) Transcript_20928:165-608(-)